MRSPRSKLFSTLRLQLRNHVVTIASILTKQRTGSTVSVFNCSFFAEKDSLADVVGSLLGGLPKFDGRRGVTREGVASMIKRQSVDS